MDRQDLADDSGNPYENRPYLPRRGSEMTSASPADQRVLHDYFEPSIPLRDDGALEYRRVMSARDPSLPQRAGRTLKRFEQVVGRQIVWAPKRTVIQGRGRQAGRAIYVRSILKPQPGADKLARLLYGISSKEQWKERGRDRAA